MYPVVLSLRRGGKGNRLSIIQKGDPVYQREATSISWGRS
jgi:hypothetical protein